MTHCYAFKLGIKFLHLLSKCLTAVRFALTPCATWCPPCRAELKQVQQRIIDRFKGEEFVFLPISRGETQETVAAFREAQGYTFPMGLDPNKEIYSLFASMTIPRNFIIDQEGKIVVCEVGYTPGKLTDMIGQVENLLK